MVDDAERRGSASNVAALSGEGDGRATKVTCGLKDRAAACPLASQIFRQIDVCHVSRVPQHAYIVLEHRYGQTVSGVSVDRTFREFLEH